MSEDDYTPSFKIVTSIISLISLIPYTVFLVYLIFQRKQDIYKFTINIILLVSCFLQSLVYPLHTLHIPSDNSFYCNFLGSIDIISDYCKLSIAIIKTLTVFEDHVGIFEGSNINRKTLKLWIINISISVIFPLIMGVFSVFLGNTNKGHNGLCYPSNINFRLVIYIGFLIYYLIFFSLAWTILLKMRNKSYPLSDILTISNDSLDIDNNRLTILLCYSLMIFINMLQFLGFIVLFIELTLHDKSDYNLISDILRTKLEPITIPIFFVFFEIDDSFSLFELKNTFMCAPKRAAVIHEESESEEIEK